MERPNTLFIFAALAATASFAWMYFRNTKAKVVASSPIENLSARLKKTIVRGRQIPSELRHQVHEESKDDDGIRWSRESICGETFISSQQKIPFRMAWPSLSVPQPHPVVFVLHGTTGSKDQPVITDVMKKYASKGWVSVSYDSRYHGERAGGGPRGSAYFQALVDAYRGSAEQPFIFDPAWDLMRLIDHVESRPDLFDTKRIGATGISLGGMIVWFAAAVDPRIGVPVPLIGVQGFAYAIEQQCYHARVDSIRPLFKAACEDEGKDDVDGSVVEAVWDKIVPGIRGEFDAPNTLQLLASRPTLVVNGAKDPRCPIAAVRQAVDHAKASTPGARLELFVDESAGHEVTSLMWENVDSWFERHL